ncbi:MAG: hypothetical protein M5R36_09725 [Deltaproteobacteria bacterium]|nr:hypothetical protein [Deltaproteobacteria bacterium]
MPVMRDYYCTSVAKAGYAWHPAEFLVQSGFFAGDWDVVILDAVAENLSEYAALARVTREPADVVFGLVGAADPNADLDFLRRVPARFKAVSGEVVQPDAAAFLSRTPGFDAAVSDFSTPGLLTAAHGEREAEGVAIRHGDEIAPALPTRERVFRIPRPRHELSAGPPTACRSSATARSRVSSPITAAPTIARSATRGACATGHARRTNSATNWPRLRKWASANCS